MNSFTAPSNEKPPTESGKSSTINVGDIHVEGNVEAPIIIGNNNKFYNFTSHTEHGVVVNIESPPTIKRRDLKPRPPRTPREFVGRERELNDLEKLIQKKEAVLIYGHEGIGKTTLVKRAASRDPALAFPDGVLYIEGTGENNAQGFEDILQYIFDAFYESYPPVKVSTSAAQVHIGNTKPLIILDNLELPTNSLSKLPDILSQGCILVTSRNANIDDTYMSIKLSTLQHTEAVQLLIEKSGVISDSNSLPLLDRICVLLEDTPLAIAKIASLIHEGRLTLKAAVDGLGSIQPPSTNKAQAAIERSFGLIYTVLNHQEREMLAAVAAAPGLSVDRPWLESIAGGKETSKALESLELLQANSPRLRLHDGLKHVLKAGRSNFQAFQESLLKHFINKLQISPLDFGYVADELGNILGLIQWATEGGRWSSVVALGKAIDPYLTINGLWDAWENILNQVLVAGEKLEDLEVQAWALHQLGSRDIGIGGIPQAIKRLVHALRIREALGDRDGAAYTRYNLNIILPSSNNGHNQDRKKQSKGNGTYPPNGIGWINGLRYWLAEYTEWLFPFLLGVFAIFIIIWIFLYNQFNSQLELSVQAENLIYADPANNVIQYTYTVKNKRELPLEGPLTITSKIVDTIDCQSFTGIGNFDDLFDPSETITCKSIYKISPADLQSGSVTNRVQAQLSENIKSNRASATTVLASSQPSIELSVIPNVSTYDRDGQEIRYTYTIKNIGNAILRLPLNITDNKLKPACDIFNMTHYSEGALYPDDTIICIATYKITQTDLDNGSVTNTATTTLDDIKSNQVTITINADTFTEIALTTTVDTESFETVGQPITYTYTIENIGNISLNKSPIVTNNLSTTPCISTKPFDKDRFQPGEKVNCTSAYIITQADLDNGYITNYAKATVGELTSFNSLSIFANRKLALALSKSADPDNYNYLDQVIIYTYEIKNSGNVTHRGEYFIHDDHIDNGNEFLCGSDVLPPNATITCTASYKIKATDLDTRSVINKAIAVLKTTQSPSLPTPTLIATEDIPSVTTPTVTQAPIVERQEIRSQLVTVKIICPPPPTSWVPYFIQSGDTFTKIARWYTDLGTTVSDLQKNNCKPTTDLRVGERLYVPRTPPTIITGVVFADPNHNNQQDPGEEGLPGIIVTLMNWDTKAVIATTTTGTGGRYTFSSLDTGNYQIFQTKIPSLLIGQIRDNINFGVSPAE